MDKHTQTMTNKGAIQGKVKLYTDCQQYSSDSQQFQERNISRDGIMSSNFKNRVLIRLYFSWVLVQVMLTVLSVYQPEIKQLIAGFMNPLVSRSTGQTRISLTGQLVSC